MRIRALTPWLCSIALLLALPGCDPADADDDAPDAAPDTDGGEGEGELAPIDIVGDYIDDYDSPHAITAEGWTQGADDTLSTTRFTAVDNAARVAIGQNTAEHPFAADRFSRFDWAFVDGRLWYCQPAFDAADAATAAATPAPDASDPAIGGCGGFAWTGLAPATPPAIAGAYTDDFAGAHEITAHGWIQGEGAEASRFVFTAVGEGWAIALNDPANRYSPGLWSRFDWTVADGVLYACQSAYDAPTAAAARAAMADARAPADGGCGMFPWSALTPVADGAQ